MKKKLFLLCMAAALVLTACGSETEEPVVAETVETEAPEEVEEAAPVETEVVEAESETAAEAESVEETETAEEEVSFTKGILTETGWESEWLGMRFVTGDGMVMSTEEELNEAMGIGQEMLSEDFNELQLKYAELNTVYEMMCTAPDQVTNVSVSIENVMVDIDTDTFVDMFKATLGELSAMSMTFVNEGEDVTLAGKDFKKLQCEVDYEGITLLQDYYLAMQDSRAISIVITYLDEAEAEKLMSGFQAY